MVGFILSAFTDELSPMLDEQIMVLKKHKFSHIELRTINNKNITELSNEEVRIVSRKLEFDEVDVSSICSQIGRVSVNDNFDWQLEQFKRTVEIANIMSTTRIRISSFFIPQEEDYAKYQGEIVHRLGVLSEYATKQGVSAFLENEQGTYADSSARIYSIHRELRDNIKFIFNPANTISTGEDCYKFYLNISNLIDYFYIKDARADGTIVPVGDGVCDIVKILSHYRKNYMRKTPVVLTLQPGLFIANDGLEYHYENSSVAFDIAMTTLKSKLEKEGLPYI